MNKPARTPVPAPWYRHRWPWFLISIPAASVVVGTVYAYLAVSTQDGLVVDDYYKEGIAINRQFDRQNEALRLHLTALADLDRASGRVTVHLRGDASPPELSLMFIHPTHSGHDQTVRLLRTALGSYAGQVAPLQPAHWHMDLEDESRAWRLTGDWPVAERAQVTLAPKHSG